MNDEMKEGSINTVDANPAATNGFNSSIHIDYYPDRIEIFEESRGKTYKQIVYLNGDGKPIDITKWEQV